jgi:hypothetical protein
MVLTKRQRYIGMRQPGSVARNSRSNGISTETMKSSTKSEARFAVCIDNTGYLASLEMRKLYRVLPDAEAESHGQIRVVDESGEDYLYPGSSFLKLDHGASGMSLPWARVRDKPGRLFARDAVLRSLRRAAAVRRSRPKGR